VPAVERIVRETSCWLSHLDLPPVLILPFKRGTPIRTSIVGPRNQDVKGA
jgi:hypothetical protein